MRKRYRRWLVILIGILLVLVAGGLIFWVATTPAVMPQALQAMVSDKGVTVQQSGWLNFEPVTGEPDTGFIFYPGGHVPAEAYAPYAHAIAAEGYLAVIVPMPLDLAILDANRAMAVIEAYPAISNWVIGGHSLGGVMAARFAHDHPEAVKGLVLWASYPENSKSLADSSLVVASISGTLDGLSTPAKIEDSRPLLPADTLYIAITGGNHGQFGWYGPQAGDNPATISREDQQAQTVAGTLKVLTLSSQ